MRQNAPENDCKRKRKRQEKLYIIIVAGEEVCAVQKRKDIKKEGKINIGCFG